MASENPISGERYRRDLAFDGVLDLVGFGVFVVDIRPDGRFVYRRINEQLERDIGMTREQVEGHTPHEILPEEWADRLVANYRDCVARGKTCTYEDYLDSPTGRRWAITRLKPVGQVGDRIDCLVGVSCEVTDKQRAIEALERVREVLAASTPPSPVQSPQVGLSPRERQVLARLADGRSNGEIAAMLHVAESTVKTHVRAVLRKLGVSNRTEAAARARRLGLLGLG